jgi:hypothetical protein
MVNLENQAICQPIPVAVVHTANSARVEFDGGAGWEQKLRQKS